MRLITESDPAVRELRGRLDALHAIVYSTPTFLLSNQNYFWVRLIPEIAARAVPGKPCRILEVGAGLSGFPSFLAEHGLREQVHLTLHDIFPGNLSRLQREADDVQIGPVPQLKGKFDLVISSFVIEHMTDPRASLEAMWDCLAAGGACFFVCPRYEGFLYLPPACDHLRGVSRLSLRLHLLARRIRARVSGQPAFLLLADAAAFHLPFAPDRDAIHLVSWHDLQAFFHQKRSRVARLRICWLPRFIHVFTWGGFKSVLVTRFAMLAGCARKP